MRAGRVGGPTQAQHLQLQQLNSWTPWRLPCQPRPTWRVRHQREAQRLLVRARLQPGHAQDGRGGFICRAQRQARAGRAVAAALVARRAPAGGGARAGRGVVSSGCQQGCGSCQCNTMHGLPAPHPHPAHLPKLTARQASQTQSGAPSPARGRAYSNRSRCWPKKVCSAQSLRITAAAASAPSNSCRRGWRCPLLATPNATDACRLPHQHPGTLPAMHSAPTAGPSRPDTHHKGKALAGAGGVVPRQADVADALQRLEERLQVGLLRVLGQALQDRRAAGTWQGRVRGCSAWERPAVG